MRKRLKKLLKKEKTLFGKIKNILFGTIAYILWANFILWVYGETIPEFASTISLQSFLPKPPPSKELVFVGMCILAPLIEELFYRAPLSVIRYIKIPGILILSILFSSILFAVHHKLGFYAGPVQGMAGLLFCYVYIKNGYSYISSVIMHFLINFYLFLQ